MMTKTVRLDASTIDHFIKVQLRYQSLMQWNESFWVFDEQHVHIYKDFYLQRMLFVSLLLDIILE